MKACCLKAEVLILMDEADMEKHAGWKQAADPMSWCYFKWKIAKSFSSWLLIFMVNKAH